METLNEFVNLEIVKYFYVNAKPANDAPLARVYWVRDRQVSYVRDVIHAYIEDNYVTHPINLDPFAL